MYPRRIYFTLLDSDLELVEANEAAGLDDDTLLDRRICNIELNLLDRATGVHHVNSNVFQVTIERTTDTQHEDRIVP